MVWDQIQCIIVEHTTTQAMIRINEINLFDFEEIWNKI